MRVVLLFLFSILLADAAEVVPRGRYRMEFEAQATGRLYPEDWSLIGVKADYPEVRLRFRNAAGKVIPAGRVSNRFRIFDPGIVSGSLEFYAPPGAVKAELAGYRAEIRKTHLVPVTDKDSLHIPLHPHCPAILARVQISRLPDGSSLYDAGSGVVDGAPVPVEPGQQLRLTVDGARSDRRSGLVIRTDFYLADGKTFLRRNVEPLRISGSRKCFTYDFTVPPEADWLRIWMMWGVVYDYRIEKIK